MEQKEIISKGLKTDHDLLLTLKVRTRIVFLELHEDPSLCHIVSSKVLKAR